jgi:hypothetical protein
MDLSKTVATTPINAIPKEEHTRKILGQAGTGRPEIPAIAPSQTNTVKNLCAKKAPDNQTPIWDPYSKTTLPTPEKLARKRE